MQLRLLACLCLLTPAFAGELEDAMAEYRQADAEMQRGLAELRKNLRARLLALVEDDQQRWLGYRESMSEFQARDNKPDESVERWSTASALSAQRSQWLKAWKLVDERKGWAGHYVDSYGGTLLIMEKDGKHSFSISVVRGPTYHSGSIHGELTIEGEHATFQVRAMPDEELTVLKWSPAGDGSGRLKLEGKNTGYFHGARAYFDGLYLWTGKLGEQEKAHLQEQLNSDFGK